MAVTWSQSTSPFTGAQANMGLHCNLHCVVVFVLVVVCIYVFACVCAWMHACMCGFEPLSPTCE